jgi:hypothetical protein
MNEGQIKSDLVSRVVVAKYEKNTPRTKKVMINVKVLGTTTAASTGTPT